MSKRRSETPPGRGKALELWQPPEGAGEPLFCIATTFTFDAAFFETECLGRFLEMDTHPQESDAVGYLIEREEKLAAARVAVLVDRRYAQEKESLRWDVLPVIVPRVIQHAKLALLCWANHVRVIVGSGNLTEPGYRKNVEVFGALDTSRDEGGQVEQILRCLEFLNIVVDRASGDEDRAGPKRRAREALAAARRHVEGWPAENVRHPRVVAVFGGTGSSVLEQYGALWPSQSPARDGAVLSPFFDCGSESGELGSAFAGLLAKRGRHELDFHVSVERIFPDGRVRVHAPKSLVTAAAQLCDVTVLKVLPEQDGETRSLHAKSLFLGNEQWDLVLIGSSNFTRAGLGGVGNGSTNLEANLVYIFKADDPGQSDLDDAWPKRADEPLDIDSDNLVWDPTTEEEGEGESLVSLPAAFREVLYEPGETPRLRLLLDTGLPSEWSIRVPEGDVLLHSAAWQGGAGEHLVDWSGRPAPFVLQVTWTAADHQLAASWPVNVAEPARLPPPDCLRDLTLEEFLEVLSSTRPIHDAVVRVLQRRRRTPKEGIDLDPHKRVNTETFLLRRTKRVAAALERLRERLERPVFSIDAFEWRLRGPIGAVSLAEAFRKEARTPGEARFFLVELALALKRVDPRQAARGGLATKTIRERIAGCVDEVEAIAISLADDRPSPLDDYVREGFLQARR